MGIRSRIQQRNRFVSEPQENGIRRFSGFLAISLVAHICFFLTLVLVQEVDFSTPKPRVVRVDLVSFAPGPAGTPSASESVPPERPRELTRADVSLESPRVDAPEAPPAPPVPVVKKPDISLKKKPKNIKELIAKRDKKTVENKKTKTLKPKPKKDPERELEQARQALAKKVEAQDRKKISQALERMKAAIAARDAETTQGAGQGSDPGGGLGRNGFGPLELYKMILASVVNQNWVFNDVLAGMNPNLEVRVFVKILKSGEIRDISYETKSGNQYFDESAKNALRRSNPLPELPKGMASYDVVLVFNPKGLK